MTARDENRRHPRVPLDDNAPAVFLALDITRGEQSLGKGRIVNIAEEGIFLATKVALESGSTVALRLSVEGGETHAANGAVVWQGPNGVGVRFAEPSDGFRQFVRELAAADLDERWDLLQTITSAVARVE